MTDRTGTSRGTVQFGAWLEEFERNRWTPAFIAVIAVILRLVVGRVLAVPSMLEADAYQYDRIAVNLLSGREFSILPGEPTAWRAPGYPAFLAAIYSVAGAANWSAVRVVQALTDGGTALVTFSLGQRLFSRRAGLLAAALVAVSPALMSSSTFVLSESWYGFLLVGGLLCYERVIRAPRARWIVLAGIVFGFGALTRPEALVVPGILVIAELARRAPGNVRSRVRTATLTWLIMGLTVLPWTLRNARRFDAFIPVSLHVGVAMWTGNYIPWDGHMRGRDLTPAKELFGGLDVYRSQDAVTVDRRMLRAALGDFVEHPLEHAAFFVKKLPRIWAPVPATAEQVFGSRALLVACWIWHVALIALAVVAVMRAGSSADPGAVILICLLLVSWTLIHTAFEPLGRYLLPVLPVLFLLSAAGLAGASGRPRQQAA